MQRSKIIRLSAKLGALALVVAALVAWVKPPSTTPTREDGRQLVWADEFDYEGLPDSARWSYDVGSWGWGNNELQSYTAARPQNARVTDGKLIIQAHRERFDSMDYTSARLVTRGRSDWAYGYVEARAKLPTGLGTWPAIWMLGSNIGEAGWPACGEIDIMEHVGYAPDSVYGTIHCPAFNHMLGTQVDKALALPDAENEFHTYAVDWDASRIDFLVDDSVYHTFQRPDSATVAHWPFDSTHYLLMNLAVGGNWGGKHGVDTTIWPQQMEVDWVRVWQ